MLIGIENETGAVSQRDILTPNIGDVVLDSSNVEISDKPNSTYLNRIVSSPALIIDINKEKDIWYHLLAVDGLSGWTDKIPFNLQTVNLKNKKDILRLRKFSPDDPNFISPDFNFLEVKPTGQIKLLGASQNKSVASIEQYMIPFRKNPFNIPWLKVEIDGIYGWISPYDVCINWKIKFFENQQNILKNIDQFGFKGLVRAPFFDEPISKLLYRYKPHKGVNVTYKKIEDKDFKKLKWQSEQHWENPELLLRMNNAKIFNEISAIIMFSAFPTNAKFPSLILNGFAFISLNEKVVYAIVESYKSYVVDFLQTDLDDDGFPEVLLEIIYVYGDGYYSELMVIGGRSIADYPKIQYIGLGNDCGETGCVNNQRFWWVDGNTPKPKIWRITSSQKYKINQAISYYYRDGVIYAENPKDDQHSVILAEANSYVEIQQKKMALEKKINQKLPIFTIFKNGLKKFVIGKLFEKIDEANIWKKSIDSKVNNIYLMKINYDK